MRKETLVFLSELRPLVCCLRNYRHLRARLPETTHMQSPSWLLDELEGP